jgi:Rieske Fe-S protein
MINEERRSFLRWAIYGLSALFSAILGIPALFYLADPRNRPAAQRGYRTVQGVKFSELRDGEPLQGVLRDIRRDAWTLHPNDVIGRVWVVKRGNDLKAYTTICPHLGCSINLDPPGPNRGFTCPCHGGKFHLDGSLDVNVPQNPAPRGMDDLACRRERDPSDPDPNNRNLIQVIYQNFKQGEHEKMLKT